MESAKGRSKEDSYTWRTGRAVNETSGKSGWRGTDSSCSNGLEDLATRIRKAGSEG